VLPRLKNRTQRNRNNETGGTRTHDLSIKSAVLYRLSYDLELFLVGLVGRFVGVVLYSLFDGFIAGRQVVENRIELRH
jgi:hypothetical protein